MTLRKRRFSMLIAIAAAALLVPVAGARPSVQPVYPTLYVQYTMNCTFSIVNDAGAPVTAIPPGTYQVQVITPIQFKLVETQGLAANDFTGCKGWVQFQLTGPGVNLSTTLSVGCDSNDTVGPAYFAPNSTFTAVDNNQPAVARETFTTLASGSPTTPDIASGTPQANTSSGGTSALGTPLAGSTKSANLAGSLSGSVNAAGKLALTYKGKSFATIKSGRYALTVVNHSMKAGFILEGPSKTTIFVSGTASVAKRSSLTINLTAGQWAFVPKLGGAKTYFVVTG